METEKIRNLNDDELIRQEKTSAEQLFRLRFQMKLGQNEGVKKLRDLRKDVARIKTITRERELGLNAALHGQSNADSAAERTAAKRAKKSTSRKSAGKKSAAKKATSKAAKSAKKKAAKKTAKKKEAR